MIAQKKILVVEDNPINRMMLSEILSSQYQVLEAENGLEALSVLKKHKEEISLILLDIIMPVMDGYTFLSRMKAERAYSSIPVIVTTQSDGESDEVAALSHGATDFVAKPYKPQVILHRVASIINLRETAAMINQFQYDRLTGLYSKEFFYQRVKDILVQHPEKKYDIICSDIENFKLINDIFGIPAGNRLLRGIARLYTEFVGRKGICGRLNADQFVCLLEHQCAYTDQLFIDAGKQVSSLTNGKTMVMKWGIYSVEDPAITVEQMCDRALLAACSIKGQYGKYFAEYDDALRSELLREQSITDEMESALAQGQFEVYLQPKYSLREDCLAGAEALVRWNHPQRGIQSPATFIPLFEKNGFITKLDQFVWDRTCAILQDWDQKGYPPISVSVNVSRADVYNADLADILRKTVKKHELPPSRLHLEITESAYTENPGQIVDTVCHLRKLGFVIEMDDFGSGYSSLNMLNQMPLDILKLDMKFIQSETAKPANQGILHFIMGIARTMNLSVVAEGVETREQLERLREIGCDYVQGYYFAKPMPCADFESLLREQNRMADQGKQNRMNPEELPLLLIADENARYRDEMKTAFEGQYLVLEAADGNAALSSMSSYGRRLFAVVLSATLPKPDGLSVLKTIRQENTVWNIPVIVTGAPDPLLEEQALELGAADYADKPHSRTALFKRVQRARRIAVPWRPEPFLQNENCRDFLTGLLNRRGLYCAVSALHKEEMPLAVYLFGLDHLQRINEQYGHREGDRFIRQFGELLRAQTQDADILARFRGGKFVIVTKQMGSKETVLKKGEEICRSIRESKLAETFSSAYTAGVVIWREEDSLEAMVERANEALCRAKHEKKGGCHLWGGLAE